MIESVSDDIAGPGKRTAVLDLMMSGLDSHELISGRNNLYCPLEAMLDSPVTWHHFEDGLLAWRKKLSSAAYRVWRKREFK